MQVRVVVTSACRLKNVNWRCGTLHPYAVVWIDSSAKCSTQIDLNNNMNPVWNEKFTIPFPPTSLAETAILYIDIIHANAGPGTKPLVGSVKFPLCKAINEAQASGNYVSRCLNLLRPSGRPQGTLEIMIGVKNPDVGQINQFNQQMPYKQHAATQPLPQPQMQPQPQIQHQIQFNPKPQIQPRPVVQPQGLYPPQQQVQPQSCPQPQVQPINQYPNKPAPVRPVVYPSKSQEIVTPTPVQGPRYSMPTATNRPAYHPAKPMPAQNQNNPPSAIGTGAEVARLNKDMLIPQNQNVQLRNNNSHSNAKSFQQWQEWYDYTVQTSSNSSTSPPNRPPPPPPHGQINSGSSDSSSNYSGSEALPPPSPNIAFVSSTGTFTYEELVNATDRFSDANLLGQGGFGYVHKGILPNGKEIAVKQLKAGSGQGEREFQAEIEIISRVHHRNLVSLIGYCISGGKRLLVYEMVPNNTLEFHLHGKDRPTMEWPTRHKIALGAAKGLAYLHEDCYPKIIHRDIKTANILLDYKFEAKVADFGLAKFIDDNNTHVSTRVMGTFGYVAPEYVSSGQLTEKSDVFSFGVMLLELITGHRPIDRTQSFLNDSLVDWARPLLLRALEEGNVEPLVDPKLQKNYNANEMARMVAVAAACVRYSAKRRPRMSQVVRALEGDSSQGDLNEGVKPGHSRYMGSYTSSDYDSSSYSEDMKKFRRMVLESCEYPSSQYSVPSSEYSLNPSGSSSEGQCSLERWK